MVKLSTLLVLVTCACVVHAETDARSMTAAPAPAIFDSQEAACSDLSALGASLTSSRPLAEIYDKANTLADKCGATIIPKCQTAFRTWKTKAPEYKFMGLDGCQDMSTLNLGAACAQTVSQTLFNDKQVSIERKKLSDLADKLQIKGSVLFAKKKGCTEAYYRLRIESDRSDIADLRKDLVVMQSYNDRYANGLLKTPRYYGDTVAYDAKSLYNAIFLGVGTGPYFESRKHMLSEIHFEMEKNESAILKDQMDIGLANQQGIHANSASLDELQAERDEIFAEYFKQRALVRTLVEQQLLLTTSDKTCSDAERQKIQDEEFDRVGGVGGIPALDKDTLDNVLRDLEVPVKVDNYAQTIAQNGCSASR